MMTVRLLIAFQLIAAPLIVYAQTNSNGGMGNPTGGMGNPNGGMGNPNGNATLNPTGEPTKKGKPVSVGCPYETKSADAKSLVDSVTQNVDDLIKKLEKDGKDCAIPPQVQSDFNSFSTAIKNLSNDQYPTQKDMGQFLLIGNSSFSCSATHQPLYSFIGSYISDRVTQLSSGAMIPSSVSGMLGQSIESAIQSCKQSNTPASGVIDATIQENIKTCIYETLKFNPNQANNPSSPIDTYYRTACIGDSSQAYDEQFSSDQKKLEQKKKDFESKVSLIAATAGSITSSLVNTGNKCADVKSALNIAIQKGINLTGALSGPWGVLTASTLAPLVNQTMGMIGTNQRKIKKLIAVKDSFYEDDFRDRFSCNIFHANKLKCEYFNRVNSAFMTKEAECTNPLVSENSLREIINLGKKFKEKGQKDQTPISPDKLTSEQADSFYKKMFETKLQINGSEKTPYEVLFDQNKGMVTEVLKHQDGLKKQGGGKQRSIEKVMVREMNELKANLDQFKKEYESDVVGNYPSGAKAIQNVVSGSYNLAMLSYLKMVSEKNVEKMSSVSKATVSTADVPFLIDGKLSQELAEQMVNQAMDMLSTEIPTNLDETADLSKNLNQFYDQFLIKDEIRKNYILAPTIENLKKLTNDLNKSVRYDSNGKLKDAPAQLTTTLYPMFRDCVMNYQAGLEPQKDGTFSVNKDYQKSCGFLKSCEGTKNTIGLPFDLNSKEQGNPKATNAKDFKACSIAYNFELLSSRFKDEILSKNSICGTPVKEAIQGLPKR